MKPRRDITLGEMQDECKKHWNNGNFGYCGKCQYMSVCCHYERYCPAQLNLTDPPRFNEQQMAFWRSLYDIGVKYVFRAIKLICLSDDENPEHAPVANLGTIKISAAHDWLKLCETLDLAELLGKESNEK